MSLKRLSVQNIRNISKASLDLAPHVNLIVGNNGSGKTSLLESVYFLGSTRTFRNNSTEPLIRRGSDQCLVQGELHSGREIAVQRSRSGSRELRLFGRPVSRASELARCLPVLVLEPDSVRLLTGGPDRRRRFLNWGVFHVEPSFKAVWEDAERCLRQRNELLKQSRINHSELDTWTGEFARLSLVIDQFRQRYLTAYNGRFMENVGNISEIDNISLQYKPGWNTEVELFQLLNADLEQDRKRGFTGKGFHRADVKITVSGDDAARTCSRGELKVLAWTLMISQGDGLDHELVYLLDDLFSELDDRHRRKICEHLANRGGQIIATGIDRKALKTCWDHPKVFHVEHGEVQQLENMND